MRRALSGLAYAAGIPVLGLALVLSGTALVAFGPPPFDGGVGQVVSGLLTIVGFGTVAFSQLRYLSFLVFLGAFFPLMLGLNFIDMAVEERVLLDRGDVTTCTVLAVTHHEEPTEDGTRTWYDYDLACARPEVTAMTTNNRVAQERDQITVRFDVAGRLDPRPADTTVDPDTSLRQGAAALGVGIVLRLLGEFGVLPSSRVLRGWVTRGGREWRKERRRIRRLDQARAQGNLQARVGWLLPYHRASMGGRPPAEVTVVHRNGDYPDSRWAVKPLRALRCQVSVQAMPPAVEEQIRELGELYLIDDRSWEAENVVGGDEERVAADAADLTRWREAAETYLSELAAVSRDLWRFWVDRGRRLGVSRGRPATLRAWQALVRSGYERLARAADAYRPVFEEISAAIATTARARDELEARQQRERGWQARPLWYLRPAGEEGATVVRSDVSGTPPPGVVPGPLRVTYDDAKARHDRELIPVDWDEASLRSCDAELAAMSARYPPVGETRSGRSMTEPALVTFAGWFHQYVGVRHDGISDREYLERRRQIRIQAQARRTIPRHPSVGGSWPTDLGAGDYGISGGGDYGAGGYGAGSY
jgi:hypothetical protein